MMKTVKLPNDVQAAAEVLEQNYPELAAHLRNPVEALERGAQMERERIQAVEAMIDPGNGLTKWLNTAKFDPQWKPEALAVECMRRLRQRDGLDYHEVIIAEGEAPIADATTIDPPKQGKQQMPDADKIYQRRAAQAQGTGMTPSKAEA